MDEKTKKAAIKKVEFIDFIIAYSNEYFDDKKLDDYYQNLKINLGESYLRNQLSVNLFNRVQKFGSLKEPYDRNHWTNFKWYDMPTYSLPSNFMSE